MMGLGKMVVWCRTLNDYISNHGSIGERDGVAFYCSDVHVSIVRPELVRAIRILSEL